MKGKEYILTREALTDDPPFGKVETYHPEGGAMSQRYIPVKIIAGPGGVAAILDTEKNRLAPFVQTDTKASLEEAIEDMLFFDVAEMFNWFSAYEYIYTEFE